MVDVYGIIHDTIALYSFYVRHEKIRARKDKRALATSVAGWTLIIGSRHKRPIHASTLYVRMCCCNRAGHKSADLGGTRTHLPYRRNTRHPVVVQWCATRCLLCLQQPPALKRAEVSVLPAFLRGSPPGMLPGALALLSCVMCHRHQADTCRRASIVPGSHHRAEVQTLRPTACYWLWSIQPTYRC
jgi:hypothetical protein